MNKGVSIPDEFLWQCLEWESQGDGQLFAELFRNKFVLNKATGQWLVWDGVAWSEDKMGRALAAVDTVANKYADLVAPMRAELKELRKDKNAKDAAAAKGEVVKRITRQIKKLRNVSGRQACLDFAHTLPEGSLAIDGENLDSDPFLLATPNTVVDLASGAERIPRQDYWITKRTKIPWRGINTPCPIWEQYLWDCFEDQGKIDFLRRWSGYCLTGDVTEQKFLQLSGDGRNGKGIYAETMLTIAGDYGAPIQSEMLLDQGRGKSASGPTPEIIGLYGRRLAIASESDEHRRFSLSRIKWFTGNDTLVGRAPHDRLETTFRPTHKLMLLTNNNPGANADDLAFWERIILLEFPYMFMERCAAENHKLRNPQLKDQLQAELSGILAWCVRGAIEWGQAGLGVPEVVRAATQTYQRNEDIILDWLEATCRIQPITDPSLVLSQASHLYGNFMEWYGANVGKNIPSANWFGRRLKKKYGARWKKDSSGRIVYTGIYLK